MKKILLISLIILIGLISFQNEIINSKEITLTFWTIQLSPLYDDYINNVIDNFEKENPNVNIIWNDVDFNTYMNKYNMVKHTPLRPDIINLNTNMLIKLYNNNELYDLTPYSINIENDFYENILKSVTLEGKLYQIPWYITPRITIINKSIFDEQNIEVDDIEKLNWNIVYGYQKSIHEKTNYYSIIPNIVGIDNILLDGQTILNEEQTEQVFQDDPKQYKTLNILTDMYKNGYINFLDGYVQGKNYFLGESLQIYPVGVSFLNIILQNIDLQNDISILPTIFSDEHLTKISPMSLQIPQYVDEQKTDYQFDFIKYLTNYQNQIQFQKIQTIIPSTKKGIESDDYFNDSDNLLIKGQILQNNVKEYGIDTNIVHNIPLEYYSDISVIINEYYIQQIKGNLTPKDQLNKQQERINEILQKRR